MVNLAGLGLDLIETVPALVRVGFSLWRSCLNNTPVHAPLYPPSFEYGSDRAVGVSVLLEAEADPVRDLLKATPFEFVSAHAWVEVMQLHDSFGVKPFAGGGVLVPARYGDTVGAYYAFCYVDTDETLALGREAFGYPKKYASAQIQRTGRVATAYIRADSARIELSVALDPDTEAMPSVPRYPHLLWQVLPSAETDEPLLERVIARDTSASSNMSARVGRGWALSRGAEIAWLETARPLGGIYSEGAFSGAVGRVLGIEHIGRELRMALGEFVNDEAPRRDLAG